MALEDLYGKILVHGMTSLRGPLAAVALINHPTNSSGTEKKGLGGVVEVITPPSLTARDVVPAATPPASAAAPSPGTVPVQLNKWREVNFPLTDKQVELIENSGDTPPMFLQVAATTLAEEICADVLSNYKGVYGFAGAAGTTPFASAPTAAQQAMVTLTKQKCPMSMRQMVIDPDAYGNAVSLSAFSDASAYGQGGVIVEGMVPRAYGFQWHQDLMVQTHLTGAAGATIAIDLGAGYAAGAKALHIDGLTVAPAVGDIFTIAGDPQTYVVTSASALATADCDITIEPGLKLAAADNAVLTFKASHVANLAFHPLAMAFVSRPGAGLNLPGLPESQTAATYVDPELGIALTLEIRREYAQMGFYLRCLWGTELIQPELAARVAG